jgi:Aromatic-ring-opening dioxygenase LigAB, LigA subunit
MSRYAVNSLLYRLKKDPEYRARFTADPGDAIAEIDLTDAERAAFVARDMRKINELGGYLHLVMSIPGLAKH